MQNSRQKCACMRYLWGSQLVGMGGYTYEKITLCHVLCETLAFSLQNYRLSNEGKALLPHQNRVPYISERPPGFDPDHAEAIKVRAIPWLFLVRVMPLKARLPFHRTLSERGHTVCCLESLDVSSPLSFLGLKGYTVMCSQTNTPSS